MKTEFTLFFFTILSALTFSAGLMQLQGMKRHTRLEAGFLLDGTIVSLVAGAVAGSIGVGASYPLDSLKTKTQVYASAIEGSRRSPGMVEMFQIVYKNEGIEG